MVLAELAAEQLADAVPAVMAVVVAHLRAFSSCAALPLRTGASHGTTRSPAPAISRVCPSPGRAEMTGVCPAS
eukprot:3598043-Prymnesium_polylepis.2